MSLFSRLRWYLYLYSSLSDISYWHHPTPSTHTEYSEGNSSKLKEVPQKKEEKKERKKKVHLHTLPGIIFCFGWYSGAEIVYGLISLASDTWPLSKARGFGSETASKANWQLPCHILPRPRWLANSFFSIALLSLWHSRFLCISFSG